MLGVMLDVCFLCSFKNSDNHGNFTFKKNGKYCNNTLALLHITLCYEKKVCRSKLSIYRYLPIHDSGLYIDP